MKKLLASALALGALSLVGTANASNIQYNFTSMAAGANPFLSLTTGRAFVTGHMVVPGSAPSTVVFSRGRASAAPGSFPFPSVSMGHLGGGRPGPWMLPGAMSGPGPSHPGSGTETVSAVPELSAGDAAGSLALLGGGALVLSSRRRNDES